MLPCVVMINYILTLKGLPGNVPMPSFHSIAWIGSYSELLGSHFGSTSASFRGTLEGVSAGTGAMIGGGAETTGGVGAGVSVMAAGVIEAGCIATGNDVGLAVAIFTGLRKVAGTIVLLFAVNVGFTLGCIIVDNTCPCVTWFNVIAEFAGRDTRGAVEVIITGVTVTMLLFKEIPDIVVMTEPAEEPIKGLLALAIISCPFDEVIMLPGIKGVICWVCLGLAERTGFPLAVLGKVGSVTIPDDDGSLSVVKCWATIWTGAESNGAVKTLVAEVSCKKYKKYIYKCRKLYFTIN